MSESDTRHQKRTDAGPLRRDRSYHAVPSAWLRLGRHDQRAGDRARFFAYKVCYEYQLQRDPTAVGGIRETNRLHVAYRNPDNGEAVERTYHAAVVETEAESIRVPTSERAGDRGPNDWGTIAYPAVKPNENAAVIPKTVYDGEPKNFRASVLPHADETRIGAQQ